MLCVVLCESLCEPLGVAKAYDSSPETPTAPRHEPGSVEQVVKVVTFPHLLSTSPVAHFPGTAAQRHPTLLNTLPLGAGDPPHIE